MSSLSKTIDMEFLKNIFKKIAGSRDDKEVTISIAETKPNIRPKSVIYGSGIPAYTRIGNLVFEKRYEEAIALGNELLKKTPKSAGVHISLMDAYFKARNSDESYYDKSTKHARLAMLYGHNTGYAQKRLVINLTKDKKIHQAIQICDIVLSNEFHFSKHGCATKDEFAQKKSKLIQQLEKSHDNKDSIVFSQSEIQEIQFHIKENDKQELEHKLAVEKRLEELKTEAEKRIKGINHLRGL